MKVCYLTIGASDDLREWSGIPHFMSQAFANCGEELVRIQNLRGARSIYLRCRDLYRQKLLHENYSTFRHRYRLRLYSRQVERLLVSLKPDVIVCPSTLPVAYLNTDLPIVVWTDSTFRGLLDFYTGYFGMSRQAIAEGDAAEREALQRCTLALYASEWAARSAIADHGADAGKVHVVPMGANLENEVTESEVLQNIASRTAGCCRLLLVGVEWERKGCAVAVDVVKELNRRGLPSLLTIVGCQPPSGFALPEFVRIAGFIDKRTPAGMERLQKQFAESHFFILPSRAECFGIVFAEASANGVPVLASDAGGIPSAIRQGANGYLVPLQSGSEEVAGYCDRIVEIIGSPEAYRQLAESAYAEYRNRLNWRVAAGTAMQLIRERIG